MLHKTSQPPSLAILFPLGGMAICLLVLLVVQGPVMLCRHLRWRTLLWASKRTASPGQVARFPTGWLIVDSPSMCSAVTQCWWTPTASGQLAPMPEPTDVERSDVFRDDNAEKQAHPYDTYCYDRYISLESGTAKLVAGRRGQEVARRLCERYPKLQVVRTWSAAVKADRYDGVD